MPYLHITTVERVEFDTIEEAKGYAHNVQLLDPVFGSSTMFDFSEFENVSEDMRL